MMGKRKMMIGREGRQSSVGSLRSSVGSQIPGFRDGDAMGKTAESCGGSDSFLSLLRMSVSKGIWVGVNYFRFLSLLASTRSATGFWVGLACNLEQKNIGS